MLATRPQTEKGFTLIELLIVIGIIGALAGAVLVAVDPVKRIQDSRDAQRWSEVDAILGAILTRQVDDSRFYDGINAIAQTYTAALNLSPGSFILTINGVNSTTEPGSNDPELDATSLAAAIDGQSFGGVIVTATAAAGVITITAQTAGQPFTVVDASTGGADIVVTETVTNLTAAKIDDLPNTVQIVVASVAGVDCATQASAPACPDAVGGTLPTAAGLGCVARIDDLVPEYLAELPTDPRVGTAPPESPNNLIIGASNSGYYINKTGAGNGRITVGACYGEQNDEIRVQR